MATIDFDGEHARLYATRIRYFIPGYELLHLLARASLVAHQPQPAQLLVVGPGPGTEIIPMLQALPAARATVVEPSAEMAASCRRLLAEQPMAAERVTLLQQTLEEADLEPGAFGAVICHNVIGILETEAHRAMVERLATMLAPGGCLLLSSYSEDADPHQRQQRDAVYAERLSLLGLSEAKREQLLAGRDTSYFSLDPNALAQWARELGLEDPVVLMQVLHHRLWLCRRP